MKKKILLAALLVMVLVLLAAGGAFAGPGGWKKHGGRMKGSQIDGGSSLMQEEGRAREGRRHDGRAYGHRRNAGSMDAIEIPQEIKDKFAQMRKIAVDLRAELEKNPIDREKALELHAKRSALMQEIFDWRFNRRLDALTAK